MATPRRLTQRWWRNPVIMVPIIVAIIGAIALVSGNFIQRTDPKPKLSEPTKIEQQSHGPGSPNVGQTGGNVTIHQQGGGEKP